MKCKKCKGEMVMIVEGDFFFGSGGVSTKYVCVKCGWEWMHESK